MAFCRAEGEDMEAAIDEPLADAERKALARCRHAVLGVVRPLRLDCGDTGSGRSLHRDAG